MLRNCNTRKFRIKTFMLNLIKFCTIYLGIYMPTSWYSNAITTRSLLTGIDIHWQIGPGGPAIALQRDQLHVGILSGVMLP